MKFKSDPNNPRIAYATAMLLGPISISATSAGHRILAAVFCRIHQFPSDPRHENFPQSDLNQFNVYRTNLDNLTTGGRGVADLTPAYVIYERYIQRTRRSIRITFKNCYGRDILTSLPRKTSRWTGGTPRSRRTSPRPRRSGSNACATNICRKSCRRKSRKPTAASPSLCPRAHPPNIIDTLTRRYSWMEHLTTNTDGDAILQTYLEALAHDYDPHSDYFSAPPPPHAQDFSIDMSLSLFGIGAQLQEDYGYCTIKELIPGGPAAKSKLLNPEDRIIAVAQGNKKPVDVVDMDLEKVVQLIRGAKNTEVQLTISPITDRGSRHVVSLVRDEIKLDNMESKAELIEYPDGHRLGVLEVPSFYAPVGVSGGQSYVSVDVAKLIKKLKQEKVNGIIMDLRSNPGGSLEEAVKLTGLFIKDGPVVLARDADGQVAVDSDPDPGVLYDGPLVVMINRFSASASEIAAAALQDYGRAVIVGDSSTHGKGTVQSLNLLRPYVWAATPAATNDPGTLKITKGKFYRITGASTQLKGVASDIVLPDVLDHSPFVGEGSLDYPLPWDTIDPVQFTAWNRVAPFLADLRARSAARLATNQDFIYINEDISEYEDMQEDRLATINEAEAIRQREDSIARNKARNNERQSRPLPETKVYELTVENSGDPGLPAPTSFYSTNVVTTSYQGAPPVLYYRDDTNFFALPGKNATISSVSNNVVATWTNLPEIPLPDEASKCAGINRVGNTLSVNNPVELDRITPDPYLDEAEHILGDYIGLMYRNSPQIVSH